MQRPTKSAWSSPKPVSPRSQLGPNDRARFGDGRKQRVVARTAVVVRVGPGPRALLRAEQGLDGGVDIQMEATIAATTQVGQPLLGHQVLQVRDGRLVEASQIAIDRIETGNHASGQSHEERVGGPALQPEDAILADRRCVDEQPQLRRHRIDHQRPALQPREASRQLAINTLLAQECPKYGEAAATGQARIARGDANARWVGATNLLPEVKVPVAALAAKRVPSHLMDARRGCRLHAWSLAATTTTALKFQPSVRSNIAPSAGTLPANAKSRLRAHPGRRVVPCVP
jgi:hypothetical protein